MEHSNYVAAVKDLEIKPSRVACALSTGQVPNDAVMRDAPRSSEGCPNQAKRGGVCVRHGAKKKLCSSEGSVKDAQIWLCKEECAIGMEQVASDAAVKDAQIIYLMEECALDMGQRSSDAAAKDAPIMPSMEECALSMGQQGRDATVRGVQTLPSKEECALGMGLRRNYAAAKDAQTKPRDKCMHEECTNLAKKGGVCIRHGAKVKLCSSDGCTGPAKKRGLCRRHWANTNRITNDESLHLDQNTNRLLQLRP
eukprot:scaffold14389_cov151-Skeletonema_marinoi.AAC.2